jgi:hypothetical protein
MFGHRDEDDNPEDALSDTEDAASSLYHEPYTLLDSSASSGGHHNNHHNSRLVKNYSCGRLCDYDDYSLLRRQQHAKFGSTPLFLSAAAAGTAVSGNQHQPPSAAAAGTSRSAKPPPTSHSFTSSLYEKDYRKPSFNRGGGAGGEYANSGGYAVPLSRSKQSLGRALSVPPPPLTAAPLPGCGGGENFYAATDIIQVPLHTVQFFFSL